jgi:hypothetical protein
MEAPTVLEARAALRDAAAELETALQPQWDAAVAGPLRKVAAALAAVRRAAASDEHAFSPKTAGRPAEFRACAALCLGAVNALRSYTEARDAAAECLAELCEAGRARDARLRMHDGSTAWGYGMVAHWEGGAEDDEDEVALFGESVSMWVDAIGRLTADASLAAAALDAATAASRMRALWSILCTTDGGAPSRVLDDGLARDAALARRMMELAVLGMSTDDEACLAAATRLGELLAVSSEDALPGVVFDVDRLFRLLHSSSEPVRFRAIRILRSVRAHLRGQAPLGGLLGSLAGALSADPARPPSDGVDFVSVEYVVDAFGLLGEADEPCGGDARFWCVVRQGLQSKPRIARLAARCLRLCLWEAAPALADEAVRTLLACGLDRCYEVDRAVAAVLRGGLVAVTHAETARMLAVVMGGLVEERRTAAQSASRYSKVYRRRRMHGLFATLHALLDRDPAGVATALVMAHAEAPEGLGTLLGSECVQGLHRDAAAALLLALAQTAPPPFFQRLLLRAVAVGKGQVVLAVLEPAGRNPRAFLVAAAEAVRTIATAEAAGAVETGGEAFAAHLPLRLALASLPREVAATAPFVAVATVVVRLGQWETARNEAAEAKRLAELTLPPAAVLPAVRAALARTLADGGEICFVCLDPLQRGSIVAVTACPLHRAVHCTVFCTRELLERARNGRPCACGQCGTAQAMAYRALLDVPPEAEQEEAQRRRDT